MGELPLAQWRFAGVLRASQRQLLDAVTVTPGEPVHVVAPPGSGKTLMGLLLAARRGARTVVFAPTTTIAGQWVAQARGLAGVSGAVSGVVSGDAGSLSDLTVLTYQRISTTERVGAFDPLARAAWVDELVEASRTPADAESWLSSLAETNAKAFRAGLARRARTVRRSLARRSAAELEVGLHANARDLVDRLVAHGVETIILDECHHLLDHWALVIAYLEARIRAAGGLPTLIGLTATAPSAQDANGYENYSALLGDVDFEQPTPAVVREGNLAPYRDLVWFTEPTADERAFLIGNDKLLSALIANTLGSAGGIEALHRMLLGDLASDGRGDEQEGGHGARDDARHDARLGAIATAFSDDFALALAASSLLRMVAPDDELLHLLPPSDGVIGDGEIRVLARFLMHSVFPDPAREADWKRAKSLLADFGYLLTDRGIRKSRDPIDTLLASSVSKDLAVADVLAWEQEHGVGDKMRAVVVSDFARHGNKAGQRGSVAGALRTFSVVVADQRLVSSIPVLVTAKHLRIAARDMATLLPRLAEITGVVGEVSSADDDSDVVEITLAGVSAARIVAAVSQLLARGFVRVVVGTRGLLGEGWDSPAANTLIDLTSASTSSATQQLRGRTLRLDPQWAQKVAHNWTVVAILPEARTHIARSDIRRLKRKLAALWGVSVEGEPLITRGSAIALTRAQQENLEMLGTSLIRAHDLTAQTLAILPPRSETVERWRVGEPFSGTVRHESIVSSRQSPRSVLISARNDRVHNVLAGGQLGAGLVWIAGWASLTAVTGNAATGILLGLGGVWLTATGVPASLTSLKRRRSRRSPILGHHEIADVLVTALTSEGIIGAGVAAVEDIGRSISIRLVDGSDADASTFRTALRELYSPIRNPRFLLEFGSARSTGWRAKVAARFSREEADVYLAVPTVLGKRRASAEAFALLWRSSIGDVRLRSLSSANDFALAVAARARPAAAFLAGESRDVWS